MIADIKPEHSKCHGPQLTENNYPRKAGMSLYRQCTWMVAFRVVPPVSLSWYVDLFLIWEGHYLRNEVSVYVSLRCEPQIAPPGGSIRAIGDHEYKMQSVKGSYYYVKQVLGYAIRRKGTSHFPSSVRCKQPP